MRSLWRSVGLVWFLMLGLVHPGCSRRSRTDKQEAARQRLRAERLARQRAARQAPPLVRGGTVVVPPQPGRPVAAPAPGDGDVYTDGQGHFLQWDVKARTNAPVYWGTAKRWDELHIRGASRRTHRFGITEVKVSFADPRISSHEKRRIDHSEPGKLQLTCGQNQVTYTALAAPAAAQARARATRVPLPMYYHPVVLLRRPRTRELVYVDAPAPRFGRRRVFMGRAGRLRRLTVSHVAAYMDGGSRRFTTPQGVVWLPASMGRQPRQPTFTPPGGKPEKLQAVPAKQGDALRRIIGDRLYADLTVKPVASPCDPYLAPVGGAPVIRTHVAPTPGSAPRLTLHVLRRRTLQQTARHELPYTIGSHVRAVAAPDTFWMGRLVVFRPGQGLVPTRAWPAKMRALLRKRGHALEVVRSGRVQQIRLPGPRRDREGGYLLNGGRSLVVLRENVFGIRGTGPGELWLIADLKRPKPTKLAVPLARDTRLAYSYHGRVLYVATGAFRGPERYFRVDPFRRRVQPLKALGMVQSDTTFRLLPRAGVLVLRASSRDDFLWIYGLRRGRLRKVRLPADTQGLRAISQGQRPELVVVGDRLIDVAGGRLVGRLPGLTGRSVWILDRRAGLLYYSASASGMLDYTRIICFDLKRRKKLGQMILKQVGHHRTRRGLQSGRGAFVMDRIHVLQLRPDGTVLAVAGGSGEGRAPTR